MKKYKLGLMYRCGANYKTFFEVITETEDTIVKGQEIEMGEYNTLSEDNFFNSEIHNYDYDFEYDHNILEVTEVKVLNLIKTNEGDFYFKNVMIDVDGTNLEEGCDLWDSDGNFVNSYVGLFINDEILDKNNLPEEYTTEDYYLQCKRVENCLNGE